VALRELLIYPVLISVSNYVVLAFLSIAFGALFPLFLAMPLEIGGLHLEPRSIGFIIGAYGAGGAIFQALFFARIVRHFGERKVFITAISTYPPIFVILPMVNFCARHFGRDSILVWSLIGLLVCTLAFNDIAFGTSFTCSRA
jgi:MFS family permease